MEQPREKLMSRGAQSLEDAELLALLLCTGQPGKPVAELARDLLTEFGSVSATLAAPWEQLRRRSGIGQAKFALLQAVRELAKRASAEALRDRPLVPDSESTRQFLVTHLGGLQQEVFAVMFLDTRHRLIRFEQLFTGSLTQTSVYPREVARRALQLNAAAVIAAHNHPSGTAEPSRADQLLTNQLRRSLEVLDIRLLDHLIVAGERTLPAGEA
ncbi:MAG: DNA repair protein RadC [Burkholderiaceae bacterium]|jgi:DNA repair protein RadC|nr:DNA repair protein RadC [Burkholderiaceae bacterium]